MRISREPYDLVFDFSTVNAGGTGNATLKIDTGDPFIVEGIAASIWLPAAQTAVAYTGIPRQATATVANNTFPTWDGFRVLFTLKSKTLMNANMRLSNFAGTPENPRIPLTQWLLIPGETMQGTFYSDVATYNVQCQIVFYGSRVPASQLDALLRG